MEFNSFDMDIQSDEFAKEYEDWLESLGEKDWFADMDEETLEELCKPVGYIVTADELIPNFDYDQWVKDCEETPCHIGGEDTKHFG